MVTVLETRPIGGAQARPWKDRVLGRDWRMAWLFLAPLVIILVALVAYPFFSGIVLSLQHKVIGGPATWVGLQNYRDLLVGDQYGAIFRKTLWVSLIYTGTAVAVKLCLGMASALLLNEQFRGRTLMRGILFLPWTVPTVVVALTWRWVYDGTPSGLLNLIGIEVFRSQTLIQFLADPHLALWSVIAVVVWQGTPFYTMMFLAGLQAIPAEQYEAAAIDGAGVVQRFRYVLLPGLASTVVITVLLSTIWTANSINFVYVLTRGGPVNATMTFPMLAYDIGIAGARQLGAAAAVSVIFFPLFTILIYFLTKRMLAPGAQA
jgi:multiple sugar transport system permease protein